MSAGTYEMGSMIKSFTIAMALDSGKVTLATRFDARRPITIGHFRPSTTSTAKRRILSVPEVFIYSSNIGSARDGADASASTGSRSS